MARILIVDDERDVATMLKFLLEKDGHVVDTAHNGVEALAVLGVEPPDESKPVPDLALIDKRMPVLSGAELSERMHKEPRTRSVRVLMLTADGAQAKDPQPDAPNVAGRVGKPFDPRDLRDKIARLCGEKP